MEFSVNPKKTIFIVGPTGVGKSAVAVELALKLNGEIISADSMQLYRGMDIGTAKLTLKEQKGIPHHLLDVVDLTVPLDVALYRQYALQAMDEVQKRAHLPIVTGGSGLYIRSLTDGLFEGPPQNPAIRKKFESLAREKGAHFLHQELQKVDPEAAKKIHENNLRKVIRALEVYEVTKTAISKQQVQWGKKFDVQRSTLDVQGEYSFRMFGLTLERQALYERLNQRVEAMFDAGWVEETRRLMKQGLLENPVALQAIGYKEIAAMIQKKSSLEEAKEKTKALTRQFAKRQMTWFCKEPRVEWIEVTPSDKIDQIVDILYNKIREG